MMTMTETNNDYGTLLATITVDGVETHCVNRADDGVELVDFASCESRYFPTLAAVREWIAG